MFAQNRGFDFECDLVQGFNFDLKKCTPFGYVEKLKICDVELPADIEIRYPFDGTLRNVCGVFRRFHWDGEEQSAIEMEVQVTQQSKNMLEVLSSTKLTQNYVNMQFRIFDFDFENKRYFSSIHTFEEEVLGVLKKEENGGSVKCCLRIEMQASPEVAEPGNFKLELHVDPASEQQLGVSSNVNDKYLVSWGKS